MEAPRWRLTNPHYLNVAQLPDGTKIEWEHKETARETGRTVRKLYPVPMLLDPKDSADHNWPGEIIVTQEAEGAHVNPRDLVFFGDPTQEMEPLNAEAEAITEAQRERWNHPIESLPSTMSGDEAAFMERMMTAFAKQVGAAVAPAIPNTTVSLEEFNALKAKLEQVLAGQLKPERRV